ncbi:class A beta-lactamase-related serine hydrolase [Rhodococcus xishaensis]|uniref:class A beta-lactamase-related serine hydrolase n=1 Tax=Rhodococcus xishaensis TaxID=2487364 RepID=UPI001F29050F|nr:class A beta-lactamase-related serine hydrolase [Rhodococcus xishaensis]
MASVIGWIRGLAIVALTTAAIAVGTTPSEDEPTAGSPPTTQPETTPVERAPLRLADHIDQAVFTAAERGADVTIAFLDRHDGHYESFADAVPFPTASLAKLFIADDLFYREASTELRLTAREHRLVARMLEYSDDFAATELWNRYGTSDIVVDVAARNHLAATSAPYDGRWWNTTTTGRDLVDYYSAMLSGSGGLDAPHRNELMGYLHNFGRIGADGYDQSFGIPAGLPGESDIAVKQGWMCCSGGRWLHLSTGVIGPDDRYILVVVSREDLNYGGADPDYPDTSQTTAVNDISAAHARETLTNVVRILFPQS